LRLAREKKKPMGLAGAPGRLCGDSVLANRGPHLGVDISQGDHSSGGPTRGRPGREDKEKCHNPGGPSGGARWV